MIGLHDRVLRPLFRLEAMAARVYASDDPELARRFGAVEDAASRGSARYLHEADPKAVRTWSVAADTADAFAALVEHADTLRD